MTTDERIETIEIRAGRVLALLSFICFILNGVWVRSEFLVLLAGVLGVGALIVCLPRWVNFPFHLKIMLGILFAGIFLVSYKALQMPVAFTFLVSAPAAIAIVLYIEAFPRLFQVRMILYGLLTYVLLSLAIGVSAEEIVAGSRNQVSVVLVSFGALALALDSRKSDLALTILIFVACVLSVGSSGILASAILVLASLFRQNQPLYVRVLIFGGLFLMFIGFEVYLEYYAPQDLRMKFSYDRLTATDVRFQIIDEYIKRYTSGQYLWLGAPDAYDFYVYSDTSSGGIWSYVTSLHNSYLSIHAKLGMLALPVYLLIAHAVWCLRKSLYLLLLFLAVLVRAFGDSAFILDGHLNFCFFFFFLLASRARLENKQRGDPQFAEYAHAPLQYPEVAAVRASAGSPHG